MENNYDCLREALFAVDSMKTHRRWVAQWSALAVLAAIAAAVIGGDIVVLFAALVGLGSGWKIGDHLHELDQLKKKL